MIAMTLSEVATIVGGEVAGDASVVVEGPVVRDGREARAGSLFVAIRGERTDGHDHVGQAIEYGAVAVLGNRPTELSTVVVDDVQRALQQLAAYVVAAVRRAGDLTVVGLTGSQGKTSTKDMLAAVLGESAPTVATAGSMNNELGMPLTALQITERTRYLVLEIGARGKGHIAELARLAPPDVAMVLNVGQAHLGEFGSRDAIAAAKGEMIEGVAAGGTAVLNADDDRVIAMRTLTDGPVLTFGHDRPADVRVEQLRLDRLGRPSFTLVTADERVAITLRLVGAHQAMNAAAAAAAGLAAGLGLGEIGTALAEVDALSQWRMELHELDSGVIVLNDSYNANPDSMRAAIDALASIGADPTVRRTIAVLGEMLELGEASEEEHRGIGAYAREQGVDRVLVVGDGAAAIHSAAGSASTYVADKAAAIAWLADHVTAGDAVLFKASRGAGLDEVAATLQ